MLRNAIEALSTLDPSPRRSAMSAPCEPPVSAGLRPITIDDVPEVDAELFRSAAYRALGRGPSMCFYLGGCRGLFECAQVVGFGIYKAGFSRGTAAQTRFAHLRQSRYASHRQDQDVMMAEPGFDNWEGTIVPAGVRPIDSPVRTLRAALSIDLPGGVDPSALDRALMQALAPRSLAGFAASAEGLAHCRSCGIDPQRLLRFTVHETKRGRTHKAARELFRLAPRQEAETLARLVEVLVIRAAAPLMNR